VEGAGGVGVCWGGGYVALLIAFMGILWYNTKDLFCVDDAGLRLKPWRIECNLSTTL
jgi:hypothetical protein